jgi:phage gpG-like protein
MDGLATAIIKLLNSNSPIARKRTMRKVAGYMAKMNRKRMRANVTPEGNAMQKRTGIDAGMTYAEYMKNVWKRPHKKAFKSDRNYAKPLAIWLSKIKKARRRMFIRHEKENGKMSKGMGSVLREAYESDEAEAFFNGAIGETALDHQYGRHVSVGNTSFHEPMRALLGLPKADQEAIKKIIEDNLLNV